MEEDAVQVLEVRAAAGEQPVTITVAVSASASQAIFTALSEQLDRRRREAAQTAEDALRLREQIALVERFEALALVNAHAVVPLTDGELRTCLLELTGYADRVDGEHFQPPDLRERLKTVAEVIPVLWDANADAAAAAAVTQPVP